MNLDEAWVTVYRQESRFILDSSPLAWARRVMQLLPARRGGGRQRGLRHISRHQRTIDTT